MKIPCSGKQAISSAINQTTYRVEFDRDATNSMLFVVSELRLTYFTHRD